MNRRDVIQKFLLGGTVLAIVPSVLESCTKSTATDPSPTISPSSPSGSAINLDLSLTENSTLNSVGSSKLVQNILIINTGTKIVALSAFCTHQGCTVGYNSGAKDIECPCHGSTYSLTGSVTNGPAISPLRSYTVSQTGNLLTITP